MFDFTIAEFSFFLVFYPNLLTGYVKDEVSMFIKV